MLGIHGADFLLCRMLILRIDPDRFAHAQTHRVPRITKVVQQMREPGSLRS